MKWIACDSRQKGAARPAVRSVACTFAMDNQNQVMTVSGRRKALKGLFGCAVLLAGCGGSEEYQFGASPSPPPPPTPRPSPPPPSPSPSPTPAPSPSPSPSPSPAAWNVYLPVFTAGSNQTFDLASTLPTGVRRGGSFGVDPNGAPLPTGMTLSSSGVLSVGSASTGSTTGVVFWYAEPAG